MWKFKTSGGLEQRWPTSNSWEEGIGEKEEEFMEFKLLNV